MARKYLHYLLTSHLGPDPALLLHGTRRRKSGRNPSGFDGIARRSSSQNVMALAVAAATAPAQHKLSLINDRNVFGNTLLSISPLHEDRGPSKLGREESVEWSRKNPERGDGRE